MTEYLTAKDVAAILKVKARTINEWIRDGKIRAAKIGKIYLITEVDLFRFIESKKNSNKKRN